ncbi:hypothetical protein MBLNU230_g5125t1 [Neophaeotheca triangularis]
MSSLQEQLKEASSKNRELLAIIAETDYTPAAQKQNALYISDLKENLDEAKECLRKAQVKTEWERKDHTDLQDSHICRTLYSFRGSKGKEAFAQKACERRTNLPPPLERRAAQTEIDTLYDRLFDGLTPEILGQDSRQEVLRQAQILFDQERQVVEPLQQAEKTIIQAAASMDQAWHQSREGLLGASTSILEANFLAASSKAHG